MKRVIALCLALIMLFGCGAVAASAESNDDYLKKLTPALINEINDPTDVMIEVYIFLKDCPEAQHVEEIISQKYTWTNQQEHLMYYRKEMSVSIGAYVQKFVDDNADLLYQVICQTNAAEFVIAEVSKENVPKLAQLDIVKDIKEVKRGRIKEYADRVEGAVYTEGKGIWTIPCDIYLPCATQNELDLDGAKTLVANGCKYVAEGANMPTTLEGTAYLQESGVYFMPGKAANAGGVATSALEMTQNSMRLSWSAEEVDEKLHDIMVNIFKKVDDAAKRYDMPDNYVVGANIAGFEKVVDAMKAQGIV